jgi:hypothetical protein
MSSATGSLVQLINCRAGGHLGNNPTQEVSRLDEADVNVKSVSWQKTGDEKGVSRDLTA